MIRLALILVMLASPVAAQEVIASLTQNRVSITANFDGSEITIFGAVKRDAPEGDEDLGIVITVAGPDKPVVVRRKEKQAGIWINADAVEVDAAPSFYAVSTSGPLRDVLADVEYLRHKISIPRAIRSVGAPMGIADPESFTEALIRIRTANSLYQMNEGAVLLESATLFQTSVALPANLIEGVYQARIYLTNAGRVISQFDTTIDVRKVGLERFLFNLAHDNPVAYGLLSLFIAIAAGWGASAFFRYLSSRA
ncbi:MAG: hypothetical protein GKR99_10170 [Rhodobacteraceae bacterium]|nr:hypothetical protein [Paracoccaceae bacterium]